MVINARTDLFLRKDGEDADRVDRAIARLKLAADAGADSLYPVGTARPDTMRRLTSELPLPVNAIALPDADDPASFGPLGVGRISFGPFFQRVLSGHARSGPLDAGGRAPFGRVADFAGHSPTTTMRRGRHPGAVWAAGPPSR